MKTLQEKDIIDRIITNDALFNDIHIVNQKFNILPDDKMHYGACIDYQDIQELRNDFLNDLLDTIVDWIYSSEKYSALRKIEESKGKSDSTAHSAVLRKAKQKFRKGTNGTLLVQGQFGELLLVSASKDGVV